MNKIQAERNGDIGPCRLRVGYSPDDGRAGVEVTVYSAPGNRREEIASIEFCTFAAGGKSPKTHAAIISLAIAMQEDAK